MSMSDTKEMARFEALAEEAYTRIYDERGHSVKDCIEDALYNLARAIDIAQMRGLTGEVERLKKRIAHIQGVYDGWFKKKT
jgi:hypothetical protein